MTDYQTPHRMSLKQEAIPLPDLEGKTVLDVGCDHGAWCWLASDFGAVRVLGLDRNRKVNGALADLIDRNQRIAWEQSKPCEFDRVDLGKQWIEYGKFDVVFCFSMYHHFYENCGDHRSVWYWLWRHTNEVLLWENPITGDDAVVKMNVTHPYSYEDIWEAANFYFNIEIIGPALHSPTREVWRCTPIQQRFSWTGKIEKGQGGATKAFEYADGRRIKEIEKVLGVRVLPGSLNIWLNEYGYLWDEHYYRAQILDLKDRNGPMTGDWELRWARFYPSQINGKRAFAFRFEGERYDDCFCEFISDERLSSDGTVYVSLS